MLGGRLKGGSGQDWPPHLGHAGGAEEFRGLFPLAGFAGAENGVDDCHILEGVFEGDGDVAVAAEGGGGGGGCAGSSRWPVAPERKAASMTAIFLRESSRGTGTSPSPRMAREKRS